MYASEQKSTKPNLDTFISYVKKQGLARTNRFQVIMPLPAAISNKYVPHAEMISLFTEQCQIPGLNFNSVPYRIYGESIEMPYEKMYSPVVMSFYGDQDMVIKKLFDDWFNLTQSSVTREYNYPINYKVSPIQIISLDPADNERYVVSLIDAFPKTIHDITLDYNSKELMRIQVQFTYKYYKTETKKLPELSNDEMIMLN